MRDASWPGENAPSEQLPDEIKETIVKIKNCSDPERKLPEICMEVIDDLLISNSSTKDFDHLIIHARSEAKKAGITKSSIQKITKKIRKPLS